MLCLHGQRGRAPPRHVGSVWRQRGARPSPVLTTDARPRPLRAAMSAPRIPGPPAYRRPDVPPAPVHPASSSDVDLHQPRQDSAPANTQDLEALLRQQLRPQLPMEMHQFVLRTPSVLSRPRADWCAATDAAAACSSAAASPAPPHGTAATAPSAAPNPAHSTVFWR